MSSFSNSARINVLALLLGSVLALSLGLNGWLLASWPEAEPDESPELATTIADLHLTQRLLARCQQQQQRQDSVLAQHSLQRTQTALAD